MKTFKTILVTTLVIVSSFALAQPRRMMKEDRKDEIESMKIGYLTKRLNLSPDEAKSFWPVYNQYQNELQTLRKSRKAEVKDAKPDFMEMNDKDVEKLVDNEIVFRQNELDIMKKYHSQLKQVLPIKKVAILYRTEDDFKRELLKRIQERSDGPDNKKGSQAPDGQ
jgi:Skp family chaperone for outer membrane proteins